ncbi:single-pass membrane and coiled-coil domain-containing protein 2 [Trichosurus vulpecula]|uniref:single-pass membrane and coiled-coil domain-containing protein 2 n=1 Tax=Trichosurus vulpecula TaxID=9337 RepID=UPI00186AECEC|nr:single-pass membrane and coiled-coil domain-containing protein 2 [Trichosurus vulpecula]
MSLLVKDPQRCHRDRKDQVDEEYLLTTFQQFHKIVFGSLKLRNLNEMMTLQMKIVGDPLQQWTEKNNNFLKNNLFSRIYKAGETMELDAEMDGVQLNQQNWQKSNDAKPQDPKPLLLPFSSLLSEDDHLLYTRHLSHLCHEFVGDYCQQLGFLAIGSHKQQLGPPEHTMLETLMHTEDPSLALNFSSPLRHGTGTKNSVLLIEENIFLKLNCWKVRIFLEIKHLETTHKKGMEKMDKIVKKISTMEETLKSCQFVDVDSLSPLSHLKIALAPKWMSEPIGDLTLWFQRGLKGKTLEVDNTKPLSPETSHLETNTSSSSTKWKHILWIFMFLCVFTIFGLLCYTLFIDSTFIFETMLPRILGHRRMWKLRELIVPFFYLEVDDLLPT